MGGENRQSLFGQFGNNNYRLRNAPPIIPDTRRFIDYDKARHGKPLDPPSVFKDTGYRNIEPTVLSFDLSVARTDSLLIVAGNLLWFQSSTNLTDKLTIKYNQQGAVGIPFLPGNKLGGVPFSQLFITNTVIAGATGILIILQDTPEQPITVL